MASSIYDTKETVAAQVAIKCGNCGECFEVGQGYEEQIHADSSDNKIEAWAVCPHCGYDNILVSEEDAE